MTKTTYKTENIEECEYAFEMVRGAYFKPPTKNKAGKCLGYRNKYTKKISRVCAECLNFEEAEGGDKNA